MPFSKHATAIVCGALVLFVLGLWAHFEVMKSSVPSGAVNSGLPMESISIGTTTIVVEVATTNAERELGLSNRTSLAHGKGMLFVFDPPRQVGFWMKEMRFSLDMIFAANDGTIVNIAHNATPESYPEIYSSHGAIRYVLEVPAGYTAAQGIAVGQKIVVQ